MRENDQGAIMWTVNCITRGLIVVLSISRLHIIPLPDCLYQCPSPFSFCRFMFKKRLPFGSNQWVLGMTYFLRKRLKSVRILPYCLFYKFSSLSVWYRIGIEKAQLLKLALFEANPGQGELGFAQIKFKVQIYSKCFIHQFVILFDFDQKFWPSKLEE